MILSFKYGIAFLCTPKCASTSIEAILAPHGDIIMTGQPGIKHMNILHYQKFVQPLLDLKTPNIPVETFCLMRDPLDWANSWYRYRSRPALKQPNHPNHHNYTGNMSFDDFIDGMLSEPIPGWSNVGVQSRMMLDADGRVAVDRVFDFEKIHRVSEYLSMKMGKRVRLPKKNVSPTRGYSLDAERETRFRQAFQREYDLYEALV